MKELTVGKNYGDIFGYDAEKGKELIYLGGTRFRVINKEKGVDVEKDSQATFDKAVSYINKAPVSMGVAR